MICPGADAAAVVVARPEAVAVVGDDVVLDDVESDPHPAAATTTTAVATKIGAFNPAHVPMFVYLSMVAARSGMDCSSCSSVQSGYLSEGQNAELLSVRAVACRIHEGE